MAGDCGVQNNKIEPLLSLAKAGAFSFCHWGLPCTSWGSAGILSGGFRRVHRLYGAPGNPREDRANAQAEGMVILLVAIALRGGYFCVENPRASMVFKTFYFDYGHAVAGGSLVQLDQKNEGAVSYRINWFRINQFRVMAACATPAHAHVCAMSWLLFCCRWS